MSLQNAAVDLKQAELQRALDNRRASVRYKCGPATAGQVHLDAEEWQRAWVLDLSYHGAGLLLGRPMQQGQTFTLHLKCSVVKTTFVLPARVCHATRQSDGDWVVGCEFANELTDDELDALLQ